MDNIPMEIWWVILARLPVRSLVRFRCVSRSWKVLIGDPDFCQEHLVQFKNNRDETDLLMVQGSWTGPEHFFVRCRDTMKTSRSLGCLGMRDKKIGKFKSSAMLGYNGIWSICSSVDGLVTLKCHSHARLLNNDKLMLWNPSIRKCRLVPHSQDNKFIELGVGFDPLIKDYKLVRVSQRNMGSVEIYTVGTASWRTVPAAQGTVTSSWLQTARKCESIYFKGCIYICSESELISFDLSREVFKSVDLPRYDNSAASAHKYFHERLALIDGGSLLAVVHLSSSINGGGSIWVLDDNAAASSWIVRCTLTVSVPSFLYLKKNGDLIFDSTLCNEPEVGYYNIHTKEERQTKCSKITYYIYDYKESLLLLK